MATISAPTTRTVTRVHWGRVVGMGVFSVLLGVGTFTALSIATTPPAVEAPLTGTPACATEDSRDCLWDASTQGNGQGESFYTDANGTRYVAKSHCDAELYALAYDTIHNVAIPRVENDADSNNGLSAYEFANATIANAAILSDLKYNEGCAK